MHRPTYTLVLCWWWGEIFLGRFPAREASGRKKLRCFSASEASVTLFLLVVYSPGIIFTLLMSKHHPHNSQRCEPVTATLWKTLHPKQSQQPKGAPCWELVLMFDTCTAGIPRVQRCLACLRRCTEGARRQGKFCGVTCGSLTLRSCETAWVWVPGCTKPVYKSDTRA